MFSGGRKEIGFLLAFQISNRGAESFSIDHGRWFGRDGCENGGVWSHPVSGRLVVRTLILARPYKNKGQTLGMPLSHVIYLLFTNTHKSINLIIIKML